MKLSENIVLERHQSLTWAQIEFLADMTAKPVIHRLIMTNIQIHYYSVSSEYSDTKFKYP
jgi:hypothetical protein